MDYSRYYEEITKIPFLSDEEEKALFEEYYKEGTTDKRKAAIKERIISSNLRFVFKKAKDYSKADPRQFEDLILAGNEGLLVGFDKYDPSSGYKFLTYAGWWIMQRQLKEMSMMRIVSVPIWKQQLAKKIQKVIDANDGNMTKEELIEAFPDEDPKYIEELSEKKYLTYGFEDVEQECSVSELEDSIIDEEIDNKMLLARIKSLGEPYSSILTLSYGLEDGNERKTAYISRVLILTQETVRAKKREALQMLRNLYNVKKETE